MLEILILLGLVTKRGPPPPMSSLLPLLIPDTHFMYQIDRVRAGQWLWTIFAIWRPDLPEQGDEYGFDVLGSGWAVSEGAAITAAITRAESAGWYPIKRGHTMQPPPGWGEGGSGEPA